jgi:hypothetical protein
MVTHVRTDGRGTKATGWIVGLFAGLGFAWFFRDELSRIFSADAKITLKAIGKDDAGISDQTHLVKVKHNKHLTWTVQNDSLIAVTVSIQDWSNGAGSGRPSAVHPEPDEDDHDDPPQLPNDLRRTVPAGKTRKIRGRARPPANNAKEEYVYYVTYLNDKPGKDPIVKLVV